MVGAVAVLVALVSVGWNGALIVLLVILAVQQLEGNVLSPWLQSKSMNLHAAVVLLSVALGSTLFGIIGAFLAVPVVAVTAVVLRYLNEQASVAVGSPSSPDQRIEISTGEGAALEVDDDTTAETTDETAGETAGAPARSKPGLFSRLRKS